MTEPVPAGRGPALLLVVCFGLILVGVSIAQAIIEVRAGDRPQVADLFTRAPIAENLRRFEKDMENTSWFATRLRPWMEYARYVALGDAGTKALIGRNGWWFYKPDVRYLVETPEPLDRPGEGFAPVVSVIASFRDQLAAWGIRLMVVPAPGKPSVYPGMLTDRDLGPRRPSAQTRRLISDLRRAGVEVIDLFEPFSQSGMGSSDAAGQGEPQTYYLARDTHWSGTGLRLAAQVIARRLGQLKWIEPGAVRYDLKPVEVRRRGDVVRMLSNPLIDALFATEDPHCTQVIRGDTRKPYRDDPASPVLIMGDSFLRIYEKDEPRSAGLVAHLARELGMPLSSIISDGSASTVVRQDLARRPDLLEGKRVVIWEFVERDIRFGMLGWQEVRLPAPTTRAASSGPASR